MGVSWVHFQPQITINANRTWLPHLKVSHLASLSLTHRYCAFVWGGNRSSVERSHDEEADCIIF